MTNEDLERAALVAARETQAVVTELRCSELARLRLRAELERLRPMESRLALAMHWGRELLEELIERREEARGKVGHELFLLEKARRERDEEALRCRVIAQAVIEEIGAKGPENAERAVDRLVIKLREARAEVERLREDRTAIVVRWDREMGEQAREVDRLRVELAASEALLEDAASQANDDRNTLLSEVERLRADLGAAIVSLGLEPEPDLTLLLAVAEAVAADEDAHRWCMDATGRYIGESAASAARAQLAARLAEIVGRVLEARGYAMPEGRT